MHSLKGNEYCLILVLQHIALLLDFVLIYDLLLQHQKHTFLWIKLYLSFHLLVLHLLHNLNYQGLVLQHIALLLDFVLIYDPLLYHQKYTFQLIKQNQLFRLLVLYLKHNLNYQDFVLQHIALLLGCVLNYNLLLYHQKHTFQLIKQNQSFHLLGIHSEHNLNYQDLVLHLLLLILLQYQCLLMILNYIDF